MASNLVESILKPLPQWLQMVFIFPYFVVCLPAILLKAHKTQKAREQMHRANAELQKIVAGSNDPTEKFCAGCQQIINVMRFYNENR